MRLLLVNDDGIHATGLAVLERIARAISQDVWIVAPETEQSGASRALTLSAPVRVRQEAPQRFAVTGTPTDCVLLALQELIPGPKPDLVLSGVNRGQNLAEDVTFSGTIAGAMQGMQLGIPSIALSQAKGIAEGGGAIHWDTAQTHGVALIQKLLAIGWPGDVVMNINFPDCPPEAVQGVVATRQGRRDQQVIFAEQRTDLRGQQYYWLGFHRKRSDPPEGVDLEAVYRGSISVTPLHVDLTEYAVLDRLRLGLMTGP